MIRRASSRPRLVSDADKAFENATVEHDDLNSDDSDGYGYGLNFDGCETDDTRDDGPYLHQDFMMPNNAGVTTTTMAFSTKSHLFQQPAIINEMSGSSVDDLTNNDTVFNHFSNNKFSPSSTDDLSDYQSCYDGPTPSSSLLDLQESFHEKAYLSPDRRMMGKDRKHHFIIPSEEEDDDQKPSAMSTSTKRKRLSQHYLTPISSYSSFTKGSSFYHPLSSPGQTSLFAINHLNQKQTKQPSCSSILQTLPQENLVAIASYLTLQDVHTLSTSCKAIRTVLMISQGATTDIWMKKTREVFPGVLSNLSSHEVTFVDDYQLAIPGLLENDNFKVNLPLLTGLLPVRYPQAIDPLTLVATNYSVGGRSRRRNGSSDTAVFRSYSLEIDADNAIVSQEEEDGTIIQNHHDKVQGTVVPVVQLLDNVGRGDRCIRSDMPFPPNCRTVVSSTCTSCSSSSPSFGGLSSWMKGRSSHRRRERKNRSCLRSNGTNNGAANSSSSSHARAAYRTNTSLSSVSTGHPAGYNMSYPSTPVVTHLPSIPNQHSPLYRFFSSLSHHCTSTASSVNDDSMQSLDESSGSSNSSDNNEGFNNYGMISVKHGLMSKCKQGIGRLRHYGGAASSRLTDCENLRPFVVPTVVSDTRSEGGSLVVDVTPRLVVYFEVTIVKKQGHVESLESQSERQDNRPNRVHHNMPIHHPNNNGQQAHAPPLQPRHNRWRMPHRAVFMPIHLPLPFDAPAMALGIGLQMNPLGVQEPPIMPHVNNDRPRQLFHQDDNNQQQHRHECVAIGLSTKHFSPTNKMPGWDMESYGYHGDDGGIFHGQGDMLSRYGPAFGPGDTVGCGLEYSTRRIFFVKNGVFLGYAFGNDGNGGGGGLGKEVVESGLYPTVGVDTECPVFMNFGESPFKFDLKGFATQED